MDPVALALINFAIQHTKNLQDAAPAEKKKKVAKKTSKPSGKALSKSLKKPTLPVTPPSDTTPNGEIPKPSKPCKVLVKRTEPKRPKSDKPKVAKPKRNTNTNRELKMDNMPQTLEELEKFFGGEEVDEE